MNENREKYKCHDYGESYTKNNKLKSQLLNQCERRPYKCDVCGKCFKRSHELKSHLVSHGEHRPHKCDVCGKCFKLKKTLKSHLVSHGKTDLTHVMFVASVSNEKVILNLITSVIVKTDLINVMFVANIVNTDIRDVMFVASASKKTAFLKHLITHHLTNEKFVASVSNTDLTNMKFVASASGNYFKEKNTPKIHLVTHTEHRSHKYDFRGKCFIKKGTLATHLLVHGGGESDASIFIVVTNLESFLQCRDTLNGYMVCWDAAP
uniref:C2H2-type domain-containing protein n=1 Tax=Timema shepardi TaxID=629360 RepID=A0A7R9B896_TIMSH|nr:unnamed protein product [Timema shepardi]